MQPDHRNIATRIAAIYFGILTLIFYSPFIVGGRAFLPADILFRTPAWYDPSVTVHNADLFDAILVFFPHNVFLHDALRTGHIPLWNPFNFMGYCQLGDGHNDFLYPPALLLYGLLPAVVAHGVDLILHHFLAGFCMFLWARRLGLSGVGALMSGTVWMLAAVNTTWLELEYPIVYAALIPLTLLTLDSARLDGRKLPWAALCIAGMCVGGHLQWALYGMVIMALMTGWRVAPSQRRTVECFRLGAAAVLGVCMASPFLLATSQSLALSARPNIALSYNMAVYRQMLAGLVPTAIVPDVFGTPLTNFALKRVTEGGYFIYPELCVYLGIVPLLLAARGIRHGRLGFFLGLAVALLLLLPATPLYGIVGLLPGGLSRLIATRVVLVVSFCMALLAGLGIEQNDWRPLGRCALVMAGAVALFVVCMHHVDLDNAVARWASQGAVRLPARETFNSDADWVRACQDGARRTYAWSSVSMLAPLAMLLLAGGGFMLSRAPWPLILLSVLDLMFFGMRFNTTVPREQVFAPNPTMGYLQAHAGEDRFFSMGTIRPDSSLPFGVYDIGGYESYYPRSAAEYLSFLELGRVDERETSAGQAFPMRNYRSPLVSLAGARYVVAYPQDPALGPDMRLQVPGPLPIYQNGPALPRVFVVGHCRVVPHDAMLGKLAEPSHDNLHEALVEQMPADFGAVDGPGEARLVNYQPERVDIDTAGAGGLLVLTDVDYPGWEAEVDGHPEPITRVDYVFRGVPISAGSHHVVFRFRPAWWKLGWQLAATALVLSLACSLLAWRPKPASKRQA